MTAQQLRIPKQLATIPAMQSSGMTSPASHAMPLAQAYQHCIDIARNHYENFPTASRLLPARVRPAIAAIYAYARHADDLADEGDAAPETRLKQLDAWATLLERCADGDRVDQPIFLALGDAIRTFHLDINELDNLLTAFRMDVSIHAYSSLDELRFYCKHSANPIGRLMLQLHGIHDAQAMHHADAICTALQLINFWQDLSIDLPRGRCYLPASWLQDAGIDPDALLQQQVSDAQCRPLLMRAVEETRQLLESGTPLLAMLPLRLRLQIAATIAGGRAMLDLIAANETPLTRRPTLHKAQWRRLALPILRLTLFPPRPEQP